jgi:hypothetical protein
MYAVDDIAALMKSVMEDATGATVALRSEQPVAHAASDIDPWLNERLSASVLLDAVEEKDGDTQSSVHMAAAAGRGGLRSTSGRLLDEAHAVQARLRSTPPRMPNSHTPTLTIRFATRAHAAVQVAVSRLIDDSALMSIRQQRRTHPPLPTLIFCNICTGTPLQGEVPCPADIPASFSPAALCRFCSSMSVLFFDDQFFLPSFLREFGASSSPASALSLQHQASLSAQTSAHQHGLTPPPPPPPLISRRTPFGAACGPGAGYSTKCPSPYPSSLPSLHATSHTSRFAFPPFAAA